MVPVVAAYGKGAADTTEDHAMTHWVRFAQADGTEGFGTLAEGRITPHQGDLFATATPSGDALPADAVTLLPPVRPAQFIGLWNNFHEAAAKAGNAIPETPLWFLKAPGSLLGPGGTIRPPANYQGKVIYEGELGIVIGRKVKDADEATAEAAIFGYTCVNDVTALDILFSDASFPQWARAKGCDSFGPVGPVIVTGFDWSAGRVKVALNGRVRQDYPLNDMILPPGRIVSLLSREITLHPGDLVACGTSLGALPMRPGMTVEVSIDGIGTLRNSYAAA
jgi:2-keto-4-pentenoate hydratase/2-oxohepta-3-ene-1,7-dioic acid hydratase in catechol pathway